MVKIILKSLLPTQNVVFVYRVHMRRRSITSINQPKSLFCLWVRGIMPAEAKTKAKFISFWPGNINFCSLKVIFLTSSFKHNQRSSLTDKTALEGVTCCGLKKNCQESAGVDLSKMTKKFWHFGEREGGNSIKMIKRRSCIGCKVHLL